MPCYQPLLAYHAIGGGITFDHSHSNGNKIELPCGRCLGCRLQKAKEWALRCSHEAQMHKRNCFITLTYNPENLPPNGTLHKPHFQKFIKRLRKNSGQSIRFYMCGEYGDKTNRPHYHAILFGYDFPDKKLVNVRNKNRVYTSRQLDRSWRLGKCEIGSVTFQSAGYVARYILKKQTGDPDEVFKRYVIIDTSTGEMSSRTLEYTNMSLKPGIGKSWYDAHKTDLFPHDYAVLPDGRQMAVPTYYRELFKLEEPETYEKLRAERIAKAKADPNSTPDRLAVRHQCQQAKQINITRDSI